MPVQITEPHWSKDESQLVWHSPQELCLPSCSMSLQNHCCAALRADTEQSSLSSTIREAKKTCQTSAHPLAPPTRSPSPLITTSSTTQKWPEKFDLEHLPKRGHSTALVLLAWGCSPRQALGTGTPPLRLVDATCWHWDLDRSSPGGTIQGCSCCSSPGTLSSTHQCPSSVRTLPVCAAGQGLRGFAEEQLQAEPGAQKKHSLTPNLV